MPPAEQGAQVGLKFIEAGRYLIAAGSRREPQARRFSPVLFISMVGDKSWATRYPVPGDYAGADEAAAAALRQGSLLVEGLLRERDGAGLQEAVASDARSRIR